MPVPDAAPGIRAPPISPAPVGLSANGAAPPAVAPGSTFCACMYRTSIHTCACFSRASTHSPCIQHQPMMSSAHCASRSHPSTASAPMPHFTGNQRCRLPNILYYNGKQSAGGRYHGEQRSQVLAGQDAKTPQQLPVHPAPRSSHHPATRRSILARSNVGAAARLSGSNNYRPSGVLQRLLMRIRSMSCSISAISVAPSRRSPAASMRGLTVFGLSCSPQGRAPKQQPAPSALPGPSSSQTCVRVCMHLCVCMHACMLSPPYRLEAPGALTDLPLPRGPIPAVKWAGRWTACPKMGHAWQGTHNDCQPPSREPAPGMTRLQGCRSAGARLLCVRA